MEAARSLDVQREEFKRRRLIAMPIAGLLMWSVIGIASAYLPIEQAVLVLFICTGSTVYLGIFVSRFTGENFLDKSRPKNTFDRLFFLSILMAVSVFSIAIPYFLENPSSLPLSVGIFSGLMWISISWIIEHWIGIFHALSRIALIVPAWYMLPDQRFTVIPAIIVTIYLISIVVLERRWRTITR